ncbi:MAG TPA: hypothetical protein PKH07_18485, partial [bacterium]|nr:hypothetical protein [bacterium]
GKVSVLALLVLGTYFLIRPTTPYQAYRLQAGDVSSVEILAPMDIEITDEQETQKKQEEARSRVLPVYIESPNVLQRGTEQLEELLNMADAWLQQSTEDQPRLLKHFQESLGLVLSETDMLKLSNDAHQRDIREELPSLFEALYKDGIVESDEDLRSLQQRARNGLRIKVGANEYRLRVSFSGIRSLEQARDDLAQLIKDRFPARRDSGFLDLLTSVAVSLLEPTLRYDVQDTQRQVEQRLRQVGEAVIRIRQGERIVSSHEQVTEEVMKKLEALKKAYPSFGLINSVGWLMLVLIPYAAGAAYVYKFAPNFWQSGSALTSMALLSFITVALARVASILPRLGDAFSQSALAVPIGISGILLTVLVNGQLALFWTSVLCVLIAPLLGWDMREIATLYVGTTFGILSVSGVTKRTDLYKAGFWIA